MKSIILFILLFGQLVFAQSYIREGKLSSSYFSLSAGSYSVTPNMGSSSVWGFGAQVARLSDYGFGFDFQTGLFKPTATTEANVRMITSFLKYSLSQSFNLGIHLGFAAQNIYSSTASQPVSAYGTYGISLGYDFLPSKSSRVGYSIDLQSQSVVNNPAQSWLGGKASLKFWFD